jgi:tetratricopeptide (TPR) repeat protein
MTRRTTAIAAALSLLPLGQPLLLGSTTALATAAVVFSTQAAHAQSAADYVNAGIEKGKRGDFKGAIADYSKAIEINPQYANAYKNRGIAKELVRDLKGACEDWGKASSLGVQDAAGWVRKQCQ